MSDRRLISRLLEMFPDAELGYIETVCRNREFNDANLNFAINLVFEANGNYPKRAPPSPGPGQNSDELLAVLNNVLPDADPVYLEKISKKIVGNQERIADFIDHALSTNSYPKLEGYKRHQKITAQQKQYTTNFVVEDFIKLIPDPVKTFSDPKRSIIKKERQTHRPNLLGSDHEYALTFLRNKFNRVRLNTIEKIFEDNNLKLYKTYNDLKKLVDEGEVMKTVRKPARLKANYNIPLLQEIAFLNHEQEILTYLSEKEEREQSEKLDAKNRGLLKTCSCCYDSEVMPGDIAECTNGCVFCKNCLQKFAEVNLGEGKVDMPCLMDCGAEVPLQTLQTALSPNIFSKIAQQKTVAEVKAAGIEGLEMCPFCDFATIPAEGDKLFRCLNEECMKESCRECKEPNHIPLKCNEVEKDADVKARVFVENQMTEALLRKCYRCGKKFFKEEGCNKMTCPCGAHMCYICNQPVDKYQHFNGMGGDRYDLCPLYSDTNELNKYSVMKAAELAKKAVGGDLKQDPTVGVEKHFEERRKATQVLAIPPEIEQRNRPGLEALANERLLTQLPPRPN